MPLFMRAIKILLLLYSIGIITISCGVSKPHNRSYHPDRLMIRMAEIEIHTEYLNEYLAILKEEAEASVRLEPGVISIFPMQMKENLNQIRIVEIYASTEAYTKHLESPHFKKYKTTTSNMVKSLRLVDMKAVDTATMGQIFHKLKQ